MIRLLIRQATPASNTGGRKEGSEAEKPVSEIYEHIVMVNGKAKSLPLRRGVLPCGAADLDDVQIALPVHLRLPEMVAVSAKNSQNS